MGPVSRSLSAISEFARDSLLEGDGFEPSIPLWRMAPGPASTGSSGGTIAVRT